MKSPTDYASERIALGFMALVLVFCLLVGCSKPALEGGQFRDRPEGFAFDANATKARNVFPGREQLDQRAWATFGEDHNSIFVTHYAGPATREQVQAARDDQEARYGRKDLRFGNLEEMIIDGRPAWGWLETQTYKGELSSLQYKAVVSYETACYTVEFFAGREDWQDEYALRAFVNTFEVGRTKPNVHAIVAGAVLLVGGFAAFRKIGTMG
jgi:hypothetical protein